ncbi:SIP domain-containing protein [Kocuria sp. U4B]
MPASGRRPVLLVGDETAAPAIEGILRSPDPLMDGRAVIEVPTGGDIRSWAHPAGIEVTWTLRQRSDHPTGCPGEAALCSTWHPTQPCRTTGAVGAVDAERPRRPRPVAGTWCGVAGCSPVGTRGHRPPRRDPRSSPSRRTWSRWQRRPPANASPARPPSAGPPGRRAGGG